MKLSEVMKSLLIGFVIILSARAQTNITCLQRQSCDSGIDQSSLAMNCGCDKSCVAVKDCCHDYQYDDVTVPEGAEPECEHLPLIRGTFGMGIAIVRSCPRDFRDYYLKTRCETVKDNLPFTAGKIAKDVFFFVPVLGKVSRLLYMNIYCAICNGDKETMFLNVDVRNRRELSISKFLAMKDPDNFDKVFPRSVVLMSHEAYKPRPCRNAIDVCDTSWNEVKVASECFHGFTSYVYGRQDAKIYRNKYCAICNHIAEDDMTCADPRQYLNQGPGIMLLPYSLLFDLNTGLLISRKPKMEDTYFYFRKENCKENEVFDPFRKKCTELFCADGMVFVNGSCQIIQGHESGLESMAGALSQDDDPFIWNVSDNKEREHRCNLLHLLKLGLLNSTAKKIYLDKYQDETLCMPSNDSRNVTVRFLGIDQELDLRLGESANYLTLILNTLSIVGLVIHILVYAVFPSLHNTPGKCLMSLSASLLTSNVLFTFAAGLTQLKILCFAISLTTHYSLLAYFAWMSILSFDIWHTFQTHARGLAAANNDNKTTFIHYSVFGFGFPFIIVILSVIAESQDLDIRPHYAEQVCWFGQPRGLMYFFAVPVAVTIAINALFLLLTIHNIIQASRTSQLARAHRSQKERHRFFLYVKLALVMGVTWVTAFVAMVIEREELWYVFIILNSLQGVWIFASFVCTRKVFRLITEACGHKTGVKQFSSRFSTRSKTSSSGTKQTALADNQVAMETEKLSTNKEKLRKKTVPSKR